MGMLMENSVSSTLATTGQALADKAADKARSGIRTAQDIAKETGDVLSSKLEDVRSDAGTAVKKGARRVQSASKQGLDAISDVAGQARDVASNATDSIVAYTKKNPVKALAIAAASGAVLYTMIKALSPSRD
jgi:ElaB/YqjD/DUF883 family membrane-anchored ribosome-binding protein